jgi:hypothetical protein
LKSDAKWICSLCSADILPFNHYDDDEDFINALSDNWFVKDVLSIENLNERLFNPFELDDIESNILYDDIDPDCNYFRDLDVTSHPSVYHTVDTFNEYIHTSDTDDVLSLSYLHLNIRSIPKNFDSLLTFLDTLHFSFSFIGISETWFNESTRALYDLDKYNQLAVYRTDKRGGGVSLFIKTSIKYTVRDDLNIFEDDAESIFIEVDKSIFDTDRNIVVGLIYRIPNKDAKSFNKNFGKVLNSIKTENKLSYLLGDYNINLYNFESHSLTRDFLDICFSNNFVSLINKPTRVTKYTATLIDNIFTNNLVNTSIDHGLFLVDISDHFPIFLIDKNIKETDVILNSKKRIINDKSINKFRNLLHDQNFDDIFQITCVNNAMNVFHSKISKLYDECFPLTPLKRHYSSKKPWLSVGLKQSIKIKNHLYKCFLKDPTPNKEEQYKIYRNKLHHLLRRAERDHYENIININKNNLKKTWSVMKNIINKKRQTSFPDYFISNNTKITEKYDIATHFNNFFVNIGSTLANAIPPGNQSALSYLKGNYPQTLFLNPVSSNELIITLKQLKTNSSCGWDDISPKVIQCCHLSLLDPLLYIINLSLNQGIFPDILKIAKVLPLFKGNELFLFTNYRPISVLNSLSKIFERIFYNRLYNFLTSNEILYDKQFGFRTKHSTDMALIILLDRINLAIEQGEFVLGVFLDFSKAFDTVNHEILLNKLDYYGIRGTANNWLRSYLFNRTQFVVYDNHKSSSKILDCGVPQGSILGPLLFLIYINDLACVSDILFTIMYADDTNIFVSGRNLEELERIMNTELGLLHNWLIANKLSLNVNKTHYIIFKPPRKKSFYTPRLHINNSNIQKVNQTKFLGVILDENLSWKQHIQYVKTKVSKNIGILSKARRYLNLNCLKSLYYSFIYPYFVYCIRIWGGTNPTTIEPLVKLQKWALRTINFKTRRTSTDKIFTSLRILSIEQIYQLQVLSFVYKFKCLLLPKIFNAFYVKTSDVHNYETRQQLNYYPPFCRTEISKSFIKYTGVIFWNLLPDTQKKFEGTWKSFKKGLIKLWFPE